MSTKLHTRNYNNNSKLFFLLNPNEDIAENDLAHGFITLDVEYINEKPRATHIRRRTETPRAACIEPEAIFGQMEPNMACHSFHHYGKDKVAMNFALSPQLSTSR